MYENSGGCQALLPSAADSHMNDILSRTFNLNSSAVEGAS